MSTYAAPQPQSGNSGKKWAIIGLLLVLLAALGTGGYLLLSKKKDTPATSSNGEVFLTAAADTGEDPFSSTSFAAPADPSIALAANSATPASQSASVTASSGSQPGLYGGTNNLVSCDADKMVEFLQANPDKASAWVKALNDDPNLGWPGGMLTTANIPAYLATLTPIILVSDTRVTNHGFANGNPTELQSVLQKGTAVFVDTVGVPRVRCACGNPLAAPKATKSAPKYRNKAWSDFSISKLSVVQANGQKITTFQIRVPAKPTGTVATLPVGPFACVPSSGQVCKTPSGVSKPSPTGTPGASTAPTPTSSPPSTISSSTPVAQSPKPSVRTSASRATTPKSSTPKSSTPKSVTPTPSKKKGTITVDQTHRNGKLFVYVMLSGYDPNSYITLTCKDSAGTQFSGLSYLDANGSQKDAYCEFDEKNSNFEVSDNLGNRVPVAP